MRILTALLAALFLSTATSAQEVRKEKELWIDWTELLSEQETPRYCTTFNLPLLADDSIAMDTFVRVEPGEDIGISVRRNILCIDGLRHGGTYDITLLDGLPGVDARLYGDRAFKITVPSRSPVVAFPSGGYVLPANGSAGIPIETINVDTLALHIYRVNDRALVQQLQDGMIFRSLRARFLEQLADRTGELVWQGELDIKGAPEERVRTAIPIAETIGELKPGIYAAAAVEISALDEEYYWYDWATQWFVVSDLGLTALIGDSGLHATVRSLSDGGAMADVTFELLARNNAILGTANSNADGLAAFDPGLVRGTGGNAPRVLIARAGDDFAFIDLDSAPIDLSDRGVDGREPAGPLDAFVYADRGIYRPGETVHVVTLLRNDEAVAQTGVPVTLRLLRPDGVEALRETVANSGAGSYAWTIALPGNAYTGTWTVQALVGDGNPVGDVRFLVEDFVPPRIEFDLATDPEVMGPDQRSAFATVDAAYLYGGVASGLEGEANLSFALSRDPFDRGDGFEFGLAEEDVPSAGYVTAYFTTDENGHAEFQLPLGPLEASLSPVEVTVQAQIFDVGGRPVGRDATMQVIAAETLIGIKPLFPEGTVGWNEAAVFEVAAFDATGNRIALEGLSWELVEEEYNWRWYDTGWQSEYQGFYSDRTVASGSLDAPADAFARITEDVTWGRYRLEVFDPQTGAATSIRFRSGWRSDPAMADAPPDRVTLSMSAQNYLPGDTATVFIDPPFDAHVALAVMDNGVREIRFVDVPDEGASVDLAVTDTWAPGAYVVATAYGAPDPMVPNIPQRAVGVAWVEVTLDGQHLDIALETPDLIEPETTLSIGVDVDGMADGDEVFVTVAAVDDGVLQLTRYSAPDPEDYFLGQRRLGVEIRDVYGRLIDASGAIAGVLRQGGDMRLAGGLADALPKRSSRVVALFSGVVPVENGMAIVDLDVPDFNGRLRVMAVAWSARGVGQAQGTVQVSAPIIADLSLPRFLAPGDLATATLAIDNLRGPDGNYEFFLAAEGAVSVLQPSGSVATLGQGDQTRSTFRLQAGEIGTALVELIVNPPEGESIVRSWDLSVRPSTPLTTERRLFSIPPGTSYLLPAGATEGFQEHGLGVSIAANTHPPLDTFQLLRWLDLYPYGCAEQTTSRAMPLLYVAQLEGAQDVLDIDQAEIDRRVERAIRRLTAMQNDYGNFGIWGWYSYTNPWTDAYVMDFLSRAFDLGYQVPEQARISGMKALESNLMDGYGSDNSRAYALHILARNGWGDPYDLLYAADSLDRGDGLTTLGRALLASAFVNLGDYERGYAVMGAIDFPDMSMADYEAYGSQLRDTAMAVTTLIESGLASPSSLIDAYDMLGQQFAQRRWTSTQENVWLVMAAHAGLGGETVALALDGEEHEVPGPWQQELTGADTGAAHVLRNNGDEPLFVSVAVTGYPVAEPEPVQDLLAIERTLYDRSGMPLESMDLAQNDLVVVLLEVWVQDKLEHDLMVVDLLPAGLELENARLEGVIDVGDLSWLGELTYTDTIELRDDRFVAAFQSNGYYDKADFAYMARAVTPGIYTMPPPHVEDMYRPYFFARGQAGQLTVSAP
jgi:uncharacterized protein YfaS (alpha-2-macroglobulin family)